LADVLQATGRGVEVGYLARTLQEIAPEKYRAAAISVASELLAGGTALEKADRDSLYGVLAMYKDGSLVAQAQAQLIQANGQIDRSALKYLHNTIGEQTIPLVVQAYNDPHVDPSQKEPIARVALFYAGADEQATKLYNTAITDENLSIEARRNLLEDLNDEGYANHKMPTPQDQVLINSRLKLLESYQGVFTDPKLISSMNEAKKDLLHMQAKATAKAQP
ncbi:MAG: hypothetical protein ABI042_00760, partial [Verrucomicrobiota bacterium]